MTAPLGDYQCASCGEVFSKIVSDEVATAEHDENFPDHDVADAALICNDCFKRFQKWAVS